MTKRRHICDVDGCNRERPRWARLCNSCFGRLRHDLDIRTGIQEAHVQGDRKRKRELCRRAGERLGLIPNGAAAMPPTETRPQPWWQRD